MSIGVSQIRWTCHFGVHRCNSRRGKPSCIRRFQLVRATSQLCSVHSGSSCVTCRARIETAIPATFRHVVHEVSSTGWQRDSPEMERILAWHESTYQDMGRYRSHNCTRDRKTRVYMTASVPACQLVVRLTGFRALVCTSCRGRAAAMHPLAAGP